MRFFSSNKNREQADDSSDELQGQDGDDGQGGTGEELNPPVALTEWALPQDVTLDDLYGEDGESRFVNEEGDPTDEVGNLIPANRAEAEGFITPPVEPPAPTAAQPQPPALRSPMADGLLTQDEIAALEADGYDIKSVNAMMLLAGRIADRKISAYEQARHAGQGLVDEDTYSELMPRIARVRNMVPDNLRGTRNGSMAELALAALDEAMETGDFNAAFSRFAPREHQQTVQTRTPQLTPPSQRMPSSARANTQTQRRSGPTDIANSSFHKDGLEGDVVAILQRERKAANY